MLQVHVNAAYALCGFMYRVNAFPFACVVHVNVFKVYVF